MLRQARATLVNKMAALDVSTLEPRLIMAPRSFARRIAPALLLAVLAPVAAEFLLGDFTIRNLPIIVVLLPLYGCGALLIREVARRARRGWPSIVLLGAGYSLFEEGFLTQSLFNPNYVGQRLLDYGYVPLLGTSLNWSLFVLSIHVVWSIATPILIAEGVASDRRTRPWLETPGLVMTTLLFLLGCAATALYSLKSSPFVATTPQFVAVGLLVLLAICGAFTIESRAEAGDLRAATRRSNAPRAVWVFLVTLALGITFMLAESVLRDRGMPPILSVITRVACEATAASLILSWSRRPRWTAGHYLAISAGTTLTYAVIGLTAFLHGHTNLGAPTDRIDIAGQVALASAVFVLIWWGARRSRLVVTS